MTKAASAPAFFAYRVNVTASFVLFDPVPAITGTRPAAASMTMSMTASCSSTDKVGDSPAAGAHRDRRADGSVHGGKDPGRDSPRPAREGLPPHAALVGANPYRAVLDPHEIDVGATRGKDAVRPDSPPRPHQVDLLQVGDEQDGVRNPRVEERVRDLPAAQSQG